MPTPRALARNLHSKYSTLPIFRSISEGSRGGLHKANKMQDFRTCDEAQIEWEMAHRSGLDDAQVRAHFATCETCQAYASAQKQVEATMNEFASNVESSVQWDEARAQVGGYVHQAGRIKWSWLVWIAATFPVWAYALGTKFAIFNTIFLIVCMLIRTRTDNKWIREAEAAQEGHDLYLFYRTSLDKALVQLPWFIGLSAVSVLAATALSVSGYRDGTSWQMHALVSVMMAFVSISSWRQLRKVRRQRKQLG